MALQLCSNCGQKLCTKFRIKSREILACPGCGLEQVANRNQVDIPQIIEQFKQSYLVEYVGEKASYLEYFKDLLKRFPPLPEDAWILDVGCSQGFFMVVPNAAGYSVEGIDASPEVCHQMRERQFKVHLGLFHTVQFPQHSYDAITLFQSIEHMVDLHENLSKVYRTLKPGGHLAVTTPDRRGFLGRLMGRYWFTYFNEEHMYFFSPADLKNVLTNHGFSIIQLYTEHGRKLTVDYVFSRLLNNYYTTEGPMRSVLVTLKKLLQPIKDWGLREPWVNVVAFARKPPTNENA